MGLVKHEQIEELPHYSHDALFFHNDEITTGQLNNKTEVKIHLITGQFLYFDNEHGFPLDLRQTGLKERLAEILRKFNLKVPDIPIEGVPLEQLALFRNYAIRAKRVLELFRMSLSGHYTLVHLWPHNFDFSVEWFTGNQDEQIGTGISPGDEKYPGEYVYMNPYPFRETMISLSLPIGFWHTSEWKGIKAEWSDFAELDDRAAASKLQELFAIAKQNFQ